MALWTLLTVTYGGEVRRTPGFAGKRLCEQAKSLALTGLTIEANEASDAEYAASLPVRSVPAGPTRDRVYTSYFELSPPYDPNRGEAVVRVRGKWHLKHASDVKCAECFPEPPTAGVEPEDWGVSELWAFDLEGKLPPKMIFGGTGPVVHAPGPVGVLRPSLCGGNMPKFKVSADPSKVTCALCRELLDEGGRE